MSRSDGARFTPGPVAEPDEVTVDFWNATRRHQLTVQRCSGCGFHQFPPRAVCTDCGDTAALTMEVVSGLAVVDSHTTVFRSPRPEVRLPYTLARVRLEEGPVLLTRLEGGAEDGSNWRVGDPVTVVWADLPDGRSLPYFIPRTPTPD